MAYGPQATILGPQQRTVNLPAWSSGLKNKTVQAIVQIKHLLHQLHEGAEEVTKIYLRCVLEQ